MLLSSDGVMYRALHIVYNVADFYHSCLCILNYLQR